MKIIFCRHHSICEPGILKSLTRLGHEVVEFMHDREPQDYDKDYLLRLAALLQQTPDAAAVLSVCFSPIIARASKPFGIPYISYTVDSPCSTLTQRRWNIHTIVCSYSTICSSPNSSTAIREIVFTHCLLVISSILTTLQSLLQI